MYRITPGDEMSHYNCPRHPRVCLWTQVERKLQDKPIPTAGFSVFGRRRRAERRRFSVVVMCPGDGLSNSEHDQLVRGIFDQEPIDN